MLVLVGNYYNLLGLLKIKFLMLKLMILLIILGSGVGTAPAAAAAACPACPAAPRLAELASQFCFPLGMIYVSIPRVKPVPSIYRYLRVTVPKVSGL
jgi:hypothetical protein